MTNGILLLDKPPGLTSNAALQRVRRAFGRVKAGHTGSLDPLATGMLPICLGEATKIAGFLLDGDKEYEFTMRLGARTATGDLEGEVVERCAVPADVTSALEAALPSFRGALSQVPPMYSAIKQHGQPLYRLARRGVEVEREARTVAIRRLELLAVEGDEARLAVTCSKGTYVRTLAEDLARAAGSCAHLTALRRTSVVPFSPDGMVGLETVEADPVSIRLLPADAALPQLPEVTLEAVQASKVRHGQAVPLPAGAGGSPEGLVKLYDSSARFLGIGRCKVGEGGAEMVQPLRLFNDLGANST